MSDPTTELVLPHATTLANARTCLHKSLPADGLGEQKALEHIRQDLVPALSHSSTSPNYYGFVNGGSTPAASAADHLVTEHDQTVQVHLPDQTICTDIEDAALRMLLDFVGLESDVFTHRTFTTGATASNLLGLACGREWVISELAKKKDDNASVSEDGLATATRRVGIEAFQIVTTVPHSSLQKAASIVGLGRNAVKDVGLSQAKHNFDFEALERALGDQTKGSIVAISMAEVNTGYFATSGDDLVNIRKLCDMYGAWLHVDAAFGLPARLLPADDNQYAALADGVRYLELADSVTGDAHKLFNVPYDCGIFISRHLDIATEVFQNAGAAYLQSSPVVTIPSPLNVGIENSRRFRALPVYATLLAHGRNGYLDVLKRQIGLAREIASYIATSTVYELLPRCPPSFAKVKEQGLSRTYVVVLFRAVDDAVNQELVKRINGTRKIVVSGTSWEGQPAARIAVANWQADVARDAALIKEVLEEVVQR
ncbi:hypothetical protein AC579_5113 [Pseudocercospora musae]|uniref:Uncharacterized protein n=1 Tax=Pseudocercospora musae TaxID=113226 RepID=A0A139IPF2_9PEZI|nr:hypothetical protein AC579_5113 [Pseudocercospora musae]